MSAANKNTKPNLFKYAQKELSQDAMICWLLEWSGAKAEESAEEQGLQALGREFVKALLAKHDKSVSGDIETVKIHQQDKGIDVLADIRVSGTQHVLLIEDKTHTTDHGNQLQRYREAVEKGDTKVGQVPEKSQILPIYLKTGDYPLTHKKEIEKTGYKFFDRQDFLKVLKTYNGKHPIVEQFQAHLQELEDEFNSWQYWKKEDTRETWGWGAWKGFYQALEDELETKMPQNGNGWLGWGYVANQQGGFLGFWWWPPTDVYPFYLQLEVVPEDKSKHRLCFRVEPQNERLRATDYCKMVSDAGKKKEVEIKKPARPRKGRTMAVGVWSGEWLAFGADGKLDLSYTVDTLMQAKQIIEEAQKLYRSHPDVVQA